MSKPSWYLFAYDIRDPRRLRKVHYHLRGRGLAAQESVFFVRGSDSEIRDLLDELAQRMHRWQDDLRVYPVSDPAHVWIQGSALPEGLILSDAPRSAEAVEAPAKRKRPLRMPGLLRRLKGARHDG